MTRRIALATALLISVGAFTWLAGPLLESLFGAEARVGTYAGFALTAGCLAYVLVSRVVPTPTGGENSDRLDQAEVTITINDAEIEQEMEQLKQE